MKRTLILSLGLALMTGLSFGCSSDTGPKKNATKAGATTSGESKEATKDPEHHEEEKGPHGGMLFAEPNHKYHLELVPKSGEKAYLYLLDGDAKKAVPTKAETLKLTYKSEPPVTVEFKAEPQKDDAAGTSSRFTAPADELPKDFDHDKASISGEVGGKPYVFEPE